MTATVCDLNYLLYHLRLMCYTWVRVESLIPTVAVLCLIAYSWPRAIYQVLDRCPHPTPSFSSYLEQSFVFSDTVKSRDWREVGLGGSRSVNPVGPKVGLYCGALVGYPDVSKN